MDAMRINRTQFIQRIFIMRPALKALLNGYVYVSLYTSVVHDYSTSQRT